MSLKGPKETFGGGKLYMARFGLPIRLEKKKTYVSCEMGRKRVEGMFMASASCRKNIKGAFKL